MSPAETTFTSVEICAGAGGQAVGLHKAGFQHLALIEIDDNACDTLDLNVTKRRGWGDCKVLRQDLNELKPVELSGMLDLAPGDLDLLAGGVPCPPFSAAGKQLGPDDERDLFPAMLALVEHLEPKAVMIENVRGILEPPGKFRKYREDILDKLRKWGYRICGWKVIEACDYGVPQLRPRALLVAMKPEFAGHFNWPDPDKIELVTVAKALAPSMRKRFGDSPRGKAAYKRWHDKAKGGIAPTLVGGSKKHGGADLGPTRAKRAWRELGVDALGVANEPEDMVDPERDLYGVDKSGAPIGPKLTVTQAAMIQGFPKEWKFSGRKTAAYRQVGNAFPPPVAQAVGEQIRLALEKDVRAPAANVTEVDEDGNGLLFDEIPWPSSPTRPARLDGRDDAEHAVVG